MSESSRTNAPREARRGKLTIFLGYAAGVGKTFQSLVEARRLKEAGLDVVIGYFEPHARKDTIALTEGLETVPRREVLHRGARFQEMDPAAIIRRAPKVCVVDEFAHTNVPGVEHAKRWEDVLDLLAAGIDILTSLNVQHIESLNDQVQQFTGIRVRETVPDWVVKQADEVVMVDVTPRALLHRMERGVIYAPEKAQRALENFFTESNLTALRELAMRQTAHQLEDRLEHTDSNDRILLWLTADPASAMLIRRGHLVADFLHAPCIAIAVEPDEGDPVALERHLEFARNLHIDVQRVSGTDAPKAVADYARLKGITQILVTRNTPHLQRLVRLVQDMQVVIVSSREARRESAM